MFLSMDAFYDFMGGWPGTLLLVLFCLFDSVMFAVLLYRRFMKRFLDIVLSLAFIAALVPLWVVLIPMLIIAVRGNPFRTEIAVGRDAKRFGRLSFKRLSFGCGLPVLFNILCGQMSFVGPCPLPPKDLYNEPYETLCRYLVRPGLIPIAPAAEEEYHVNYSFFRDINTVFSAVFHKRASKELENGD